MDKTNILLKKGLLWSTIEVVVKRVFDFFVKLVLARLLFPEEFGIVGMATVFTSFIQVLSEMGVGSALIQRKKENIKDIHFQTVFWTSLVWSILMYLILVFLVTPFAAKFFDEPVLLQIVPILSLPVLVSSINIINKAHLMRALDFKKLAFVNNISSVISGFGAIILAFNGFGIWALVFNVVFSFVVAMPLLFIATRWRPKFEWDKTAFNQIFGFGVFTFGTTLVLNISANIDYLIIGKLVSAAALGAYALAFMLTSLVSSQVTSMINRVMFPFYSSIQSDIAKVKGYYLKIIGYYALIIYPIMLALIVLAGPILSVFFGNKWVDAKVPLRILAVAVLINVLTSSYNLLFRSIGKPKLEMKTLLFILIFATLPAVSIGGYYYGTRGVAYGILISAIINFFVVTTLLNKYFEITFWSVLKQVGPAIIAFMFTFFLITPLYIYTVIHPLLLLVLLFIVYFTICTFFYKSDIKRLFQKKG
jgi:teichuronic acid exporter